jgi:hypothetical protein
MSKFKNLVKDLGFNEKFNKTIHKATSFNHVKDNVPLVEGYNMMCDLLFLPTAKFGMKYLFVIVDLATDMFDIEPIKNKDPDTVLKAMKKCFSRGYVEKPEYSIKTDSGNEFKGVFAKYLYDESIFHSTAPPNRHSSMSNVEALNKQLGRLFALYMNKKEESTGKRFVNWTEFVPTVRQELNAIRKKDLPDDINSYEYPVQQDLKEVVGKKAKKKGKKVYEVIQPKFKVGQYVYRYLDSPQDALGKKLSGDKRRQGDINWDKEEREIEKVNTMIGEGPLYRYRLEGLPNVTFTEQQLRRAPNPN